MKRDLCGRLEERGDLYLNFRLDALRVLGFRFRLAAVLFDIRHTRGSCSVTGLIHTENVFEKKRRDVNHSILKGKEKINSIFPYAKCDKVSCGKYRLCSGKLTAV